MSDFWKYSFVNYLIWEMEKCDIQWSLQASLALAMVSQQSLLQKGQTINAALKVFDSLTLLLWQALGVTGMWICRARADLKWVSALYIYFTQQRNLRIMLKIKFIFFWKST